MSAENETASNPYQKPVQAADPDPPERPGLPKKAGLARRLAGGMMMANGALVLAEAALLPAATPGTHSPIAGIGPAIIDLILGFTLLRGSSALATWAIVRAALGMTAGAALRSSEGPIVVVYTVILCASLLGLLIGEAGRVRTAIAGAALGLCLALEMVAVTGLAVGNNPLAFFYLAAAGDVEGSPVKQAEGRAAPYQLTFPNDSWYARKQASAMKDNPSADRWFVRPDKDAHVIVIAEQVPGKAMGIEAYTDAVIANMKSDVPDLVIDKREDWPAFPERGRLVHMHGKREQIAGVWFCATLTAYDRAFYLVGFAAAETMPSVEPELRSIFDSLRVPKAVLEALPPDLDPTPITAVRGAKIPYSLTAPAGWFQRKDDVVKTENASIDRWIVRPELDAHVIVVAEEVPEGVTLPIDKYSEAVLEGARKNSARFAEIRREKWAKYPAFGVRAHVSLTRGDVDLEYEYALYARENRAFQITGFTTKAGYERARADLEAALDSFVPPP